MTPPWPGSLLFRLYPSVPCATEQSPRDGDAVLQKSGEPGVNNSFRNPLVLTKHAVGGAHVRRRAVGPLTPPTSTPRLPANDVLCSGMHDGKTYPGSHEDLSATVAATLLHPNARSSGITLVDIIHVKRAMEYGGAHDEHTYFRRLVLALWVLYCSDAELELPLQDLSESESETEFEAETVSEYEAEWAPTTPVATEFQMFRATKVVFEIMQLSCACKTCVAYCLKFGLLSFLEVISTAIERRRCFRDFRKEDHQRDVGPTSDSNSTVSQNAGILMGSRTIHPPMAPQLLGTDS